MTGKAHPGDSKTGKEQMSTPVCVLFGPSVRAKIQQNFVISGFGQMNPVGCEIGTQKSFFVLEHRGGVDKANCGQRWAEFPQPTVQGFGISIDGFGWNRKFPIGLAGGLRNRVNRLHNDACGGGKRFECVQSAFGSCSGSCPCSE